MNKPLSVIIAAALLLAVLHLTGVISLTGRVTKRKAVRIAALSLMGRPAFDRSVPVKVTRSDGKYSVTFTFPVPDGRPGETYLSFAVVDDKTGEVLELGVEEDKAETPVPSQADAAANTEWRPTPLNEEVDAVEAVRKTMKK